MIKLFDEFLRAGKLGCIFADVDQKSVLAALGPPDAVSTHLPVVWKYESLQVVLDCGRVVAVYVYFENSTCVLPSGLGLADRPGQLPPLEAFMREMRQQAVPFRIDDALTFGDQVALLTGGGVHIVFTLSSGEIDKMTIDYVYRPKQLPV